MYAFVNSVPDWQRMSAEFCEWLVSWPIILPLCFCLFLFFLVVEGSATKSLQQHVTAAWPAKWCKPIILPCPVQSFPFSLPFSCLLPWSGIKIVSLELPKIVIYIEKNPPLSHVFLQVRLGGSFFFSLNHDLITLCISLCFSHALPTQTLEGSLNFTSVSSSWSHL